MKAFPDYEELDKKFHVWNDKLSKRASIIYAETTKYIKIDGISYYRDSVEKIIRDKKGNLTVDDIKEVYDTHYYLSEDQLNTINKYYKIDIINNKVTLLTQNDEAVIFKCDNNTYMKVHDNLVPLSSVVSEYRNKIEKFLNEKIKPKQKLLMITFKDSTIKLYNHFNNDLCDYDLKNTFDRYNYDIEQIKNISIITVEKAVELELKLDFDTKTIEKLPLIIQ